MLTDLMLEQLREALTALRSVDNRFYPLSPKERVLQSGIRMAITYLSRVLESKTP